MFKIHLDYAKISLLGCDILSKYLDVLFLNDHQFDEELLSNSLFISFDKLSALRLDYQTVLNEIKIFNNYEIKYTNNKVYY